MQRRGMWFIILATLIVACHASGQVAQADETVTRMLEAWKAKKTRIRTIKYTLSGTCELKPIILRSVKLEAGDVKLPTLRPTPIQATILLDLERHRFRVETHEEILSTSSDICDYKPAYFFKSWNGKDWYYAYSNDKNANAATLAIGSMTIGPNKHQDIPGMCYPVWQAHGLVPTVNTPLSTVDYPPNYIQDSFELVRNVDLKGKKCALIRTEPLNSSPALTDEFWVSPGEDYAILKYSLRRGKISTTQFDTEFSKTEHGWLPKRWTLQGMEKSTIACVHQLAVTSFEVNLPVVDNDFALTFHPGMEFQVCRLPDSRPDLNPDMHSMEKYLVEADGSLKLVGGHGFTTRAGKQLPLENPTSRWWWFVALGGTALLAAALAALAFRRRRKPNQG